MSYATNYRKGELTSRLKDYDSAYCKRERKINDLVGQTHEYRWGDSRNNWHKVLGLSPSAYKKLSNVRKEALQTEYWANLRQEVISLCSDRLGFSKEYWQSLTTDEKSELTAQYFNRMDRGES